MTSHGHQSVLNNRQIPLLVQLGQPNKEILKLRITGSLCGESMGFRWFFKLRPSNAANVSMPSRYPENVPTVNANIALLVTRSWRRCNRLLSGYSENEENIPIRVRVLTIVRHARAYLECVPRIYWDCTGTKAIVLLGTYRWRSKFFISVITHERHGVSNRR